MPKPLGNVDDDSETNQGQESDASTGGRAPTANLAPSIARPTPPGRPGIFTAPTALTPLATAMSRRAAGRAQGAKVQSPGAGRQGDSRDRFGRTPEEARVYEERQGRLTEDELRQFAQATGRTLAEARAHAYEKAWTIE